MIKKRFIVILILFIFFPVSITNADTLRDVKNNLAKLESERDETSRITEETKNKITAKRNAIIQANNTIASNEVKVEDSKKLVTSSEEEIKEKTEQLQDVINTLQYSEMNGEEIYIDYIFESDNITDLMERQEIVEQIANYTQEELNKLESLIKENKQLQVKLADDNVALSNSITELEKQEAELHDYIDQLASIGMSYDDKIKAQKSVIKMYEDAGCKDNDDVDVCYYSKFQSSGAFSRPLNKGKVTQAWNATHGGIDLGGNTPGTAVYAPASGTVIYVAYKTSCGGNIIYMHNLVNGVKYTTEFAHLRSINVKSGQYVTKGTVIGTVGGDSSTWSYDSCTSGTHLHYAVSYGYHFTEKGRSGWNTFKSNTKATGNESITSIKSSRGWTWSTR